MAHVAWLEIIKAGWPVLSVLLIMSIMTLAIAMEKWRSFSKISENSIPFLESIKKTTDRARIIAWCEKSTQPIAYIAKNIYKARAERSEKERVLTRAIQSLVHTLETKISVLGSIASVAPYVGLLGTVIGIIKSFRAISMTQSGGASLVAIGIAEALIGTAGGLIVAIPAILIYNYFANKLRRFVQEWEMTGAEIIDISLTNQGN